MNRSLSLIRRCTTLRVPAPWPLPSLDPRTTKHLSLSSAALSTRFVATIQLLRRLLLFGDIYGTKSYDFSSRLFIFFLVNFLALSTSASQFRPIFFLFYFICSPCLNDCFSSPQIYPRIFFFFGGRSASPQSFDGPLKRKWISRTIVAGRFFITTGARPSEEYGPLQMNDDWNFAIGCWKKIVTGLRWKRFVDERYAPGIPKECGQWSTPPGFTLPCCVFSSSAQGLLLVTEY